jgi:uncharacterized membrane protein
LEPSTSLGLGSAAAPQARAVEAGRGLTWWTDAWALFTRAAGMWIVLLLVLVVAAILIGTMRMVGLLAVSLLAPVLIGSLMIAARKVEVGGALGFDDLLAGFRTNFGSLVLLGVLLLGAHALVLVLFAVLGMGAILGALGVMVGAAAGDLDGSTSDLFAVLGAGSAVAILLMVLLMFIIAALVCMALWFAPALIALDGAAPLEAVKLSIAASLKNIMPFLVYGILSLVAAVLATIPALLGWIVLLPVMVLTVYVSYKDVFGH